MNKVSRQRVVGFVAGAYKQNITQESAPFLCVTLKKKGSGTKGRESNCPKTSSREREKPTRARETYASARNLRDVFFFNAFARDYLCSLLPRPAEATLSARSRSPTTISNGIRRSAFDLVPRPFGRGRDAQTISRNARRAFSKERARDRARSLSERNNRIHAELFSARAQFCGDFTFSVVVKKKRLENLGLCKRVLGFFSKKNSKGPPSSNGDQRNDKKGGALENAGAWHRKGYPGTRAHEQR